MNKQQLAELLTGRQFRKVITEEECQLAKQNDLLVVFGHSDDCLELRGILHDEYGAYDGTTKYFGVNLYGEIVKLTDIGMALLLEDFGVKPFLIKAIWQPTTIDADWLITTDDLPFATFDIFEDDKLFCRGIVIEKADILTAITRNI